MSEALRLVRIVSTGAWIVLQTLFDSCRAAAHAYSLDAVVFVRRPQKPRTPKEISGDVRRSLACGPVGV